MNRKYLMAIGAALGVAIGLSITLIGSLNPTEAQIKFSPAETGIIESGLIIPAQTIDKAFTVSKQGKMFVEFDVRSDGPTNVTYEVKSPNGKTLLTTPTVTSSTVLKFDDRSYILIPMIGSPEYDELSGNIAFVDYARTRDVVTDLDGSIALAERGGAEGEGEISFIEKQINVANKHAIALIVFNNRPSHFFGDLTAVPADQLPSIPTFSLSREDGLELKKFVDEKGVVATITDSGNQLNELTLPYASFDITIDEKGKYEFLFKNNGPSNASVNVKYVLREI